MNNKDVLVTLAIHLLAAASWVTRGSMFAVFDEVWVQAQDLVRCCSVSCRRRDGRAKREVLLLLLLLRRRHQ